MRADSSETISASAAVTRVVSALRSLETVSMLPWRLESPEVRAEVSSAIESLIDKMAAARASSLVKSTELIRVTISAKLSLSAEAALRIASMRPFSVAILPSRVVSAAERADASEVTAAARSMIS